MALRVFSILEVHRRILENVGKSDLAAAARVCRTWVDLALDILWEELESVHPVMALLGPMKTAGCVSASHLTYWLIYNGYSID